jgi:hypothetical protein
MNEFFDEAFFESLRASGATERMIAAVRREVKALGPPVPEDEVVEATLAQEARTRRQAEQPLRDFLARRMGVTKLK